MDEADYFERMRDIDYDVEDLKKELATYQYLAEERLVEIRRLRSIINELKNENN